MIFSSSFLIDQLGCMFYPGLLNNKETLQSPEGGDEIKALKGDTKQKKVEEST